MLSLNTQRTSFALTWKNIQNKELETDEQHLYLLKLNC